MHYGLIRNNKTSSLIDIIESNNSYWRKMPLDNLTHWLSKFRDATTKNKNF